MKLNPHICTPDTHYDNSATRSIRFLQDHHRAAIIDNRRIKVKQLISNEFLSYGNRISYKQAWRVKEALLEEIDGVEGESYPLFTDYASRIRLADPTSWVALKRDTENHFAGLFIAPSACRHATQYIRGYYGFDTTHTRSKYPQMLYLCAGLDANDQIIPLAWALVPTEDGYWWNWFCKNCKEAFEEFDHEFCVMISDRDKGLKGAIKANFPNTAVSHCCQHIADNIQAYHGGIKTREKFWRAARAKSKGLFDVSLLLSLIIAMNSTN